MGKHGLFLVCISSLLCTMRAFFHQSNVQEGGSTGPRVISDLGMNVLAALNSYPWCAEFVEYCRLMINTGSTHKS